MDSNCAADGPLDRSPGTVDLYRSREGGPMEQQHSEVIERMSVGKLTDTDKELIKELLTRDAKDRTGETVGGRPVVAKLPHGMDVVK